MAGRKGGEDSEGDPTPTKRARGAGRGAFHGGGGGWSDGDGLSALLLGSGASGALPFRIARGSYPVVDGGVVYEPASGAFDAVLHPEEGGLQAAVDSCAEGGSVLLLPGIYDLTEKLSIGRSVHIFARGRTEIRMCLSGYILTSGASITLSGLCIENLSPCYSRSVSITGGSTRLQVCLKDFFFGYYNYHFF